MSEELLSIQGMDIYLIDQIMRGRYQSGDSILDAGAGMGRNLNWFMANDVKVSACDRDKENRALIRQRYPNAQFDWSTCNVESLPYPAETFDHVLCIAVLHFAESKDHMSKMWQELSRVLKPGGSLFIRTCVKMGIEAQITPLDNGRHFLPDGSERYLLDMSDIESELERNSLKALGPIKWVSVQNLRVMGTLLLEKQGLSS